VAGHQGLGSDRETQTGVTPAPHVHHCPHAVTAAVVGDALGAACAVRNDLVAAVARDESGGDGPRGSDLLEVV
jgi:hypothetical protein